MVLNKIYSGAIYKSGKLDHPHNIFLWLIQWQQSKTMGYFCVSSHFDSFMDFKKKYLIYMSIRICI